MPIAPSERFDFTSRPRLLLGPGRLDELATLPLRQEGAAALVVTDAVLADGPALQELRRILESGGQVVVDASVAGEPTSSVVDRVTDRIRETQPGLIVGLGGGSAMDTAKVARAVATGDHPTETYLGTGRELPPPDSTLVLVPTTAGTGSEVNGFAVVEHLGEGRKVVMASPVLAADIALVDARLTATMPRAVTAATGFDALTHALEAYCSRFASPVTDAVAERAISLAAVYLRRAYATGDDESRAGMAEAATLAGIAFANAELGLCHAISGPLGAATHVPHGVANALVLAAVLDFNGPALGARHERLTELLGDDPAKWTRALCADLAMPDNLRDVGLGEQDLPKLTGQTMLSRQVQANPRAAKAEDVEALLRSLMPAP